MKKPTLHELLSSDEVAGSIIRDIARLEWELDLILTRYFTAQERLHEFMEIIISRFNFIQKIDILRKMELPAKMVSRERSVASLEKFRKLRNILAHSSLVTDEHIKEVQSDNELRRILSDYPKSYNAELGLTKVRLNKLFQSYISKKRTKQRNKEGGYNINDYLE